MDLLGSALWGENVIKWKKAWQQCHKESGFPPQLILNHLHYLPRRARFFEAKGLWCRTRRASDQLNLSPFGTAGELCAQERDGVQRLLAPAHSLTGRLTALQKGKENLCRLPSPAKERICQYESWKLNGNLLLQWHQGMHWGRQGTGNCAEARNPAALGQTMNYKYRKYLLRFETVW